MAIEFTDHNIRLDDGTQTMPAKGLTMEAYPWFVSARRVLETAFPGDKRPYWLADLGCLEGGYAVEFARMGFQVLGLEVRTSNFAACRFVQSRTNLPNLSFVQDDAWNIARHGSFDAVFCCGLLYHFDKPRQFLGLLSGVTRRVAILQTHFSRDTLYARLPLPTLARRIVRKVATTVMRRPFDPFRLSTLTQNEGLAGRWYPEFSSDASFDRRESSKWASWDNRRSFWPTRECLLQAVKDAGFDLVLEQYDSLGPNIAENIRRGSYRRHDRGTFVGFKTRTDSAVP